MKHNRQTEEENKERSGDNGHTYNGEMINKFTDLSQKNVSNVGF